MKLVRYLTVVLGLLLAGIAGCTSQTSKPVSDSKEMHSKPCKDCCKDKPCCGSTRCNCPKPCDNCQCPGSPCQGEECKPGICPQCPLSDKSSMRAGVDAVDIGASVGDFTTPTGKDASCPLPKPLHLTNRGGSDGSGLCVFCSITHAANWASVPELEDFFKWMWNKPGGGYPQKVTDMISRKCKEMNRPVPAYIQIESKDLAPLILASQTGRMSSITYGWSPTGRYGGRRIPHMVSLVHADGEWFGILDNNYPGTVEWMNEAEFKKSYYEGGTGSGWAVILLEPGPPPVPFTPPRPKESFTMIPGGLLALSLLAINQCSGGSCGRSSTWPAPSYTPPYVQPAVQLDNGYRWVPCSGGEQVALYRGDEQAGVWVFAEGVYYSLSGTKWTEEACPMPAPVGAAEKKRAAKPPVKQAQAEDDGRFGVIGSQISENRYSIKGREATRTEVLEALKTGGNLTDDSALMWVVVSGTEPERRPVMGDLASNPLLAQWQGKVKVKGFDPSHWAFKDAGFQAGKPGVQIVGKGGESLWRQENYANGAAGLAAVLEWADRRGRPDYKPEEDFGPGFPWRKPEPPTPPAPPKTPSAPEGPSDSEEKVVSYLPPGAVGGGLAGLVMAILAIVFVRKPQ